MRVTKLMLEEKISRLTKQLAEAEQAHEQEISARLKVERDLAAVRTERDSEVMKLNLVLEHNKNIYTAVNTYAALFHSERSLPQAQRLESGSWEQERQYDPSEPQDFRLFKLIVDQLYVGDDSMDKRRQTYMARML